MEDRHLWDLVSKKASGEATEKELEELARLLQDKPDIQYLLEMMDNYWSLPGKQSDEEAIRESLERHKQRLGQYQISCGSRELLPFANNKLWMRSSRAGIPHRILLIAACFALLIMTGVWAAYHWLPSTSSDMNVVVTKAGSKTRLVLPDSTLVWLNAGSKLTYPNDFKHAPVRAVDLCGEAFFEVKHDEDHPFIIHTKYLDIRDIGTAFDVKAYPQDGVTEATLIRGVIEVALRKYPAEKLVLKPNEKIAYYSNDANNKLKKYTARGSAGVEKKSVHPAVNINVPLKIEKIIPVINPAGDSLVSETAWVNNQLVFRSEKFEDLAVRLERWYDVKINIQNGEVSDYTFTGIFQGETIEQALKELQMIRPFHFTMDKNNIEISR